VPVSAAADDPWHPHLTSQEIAEGWILLFDGETSFGWKGAEKWTVYQGMLAPQSENTSRVVTTTAFGDYELKLEYRLREGGGKAEAVVGCNADGKNSAHPPLKLEQPFFQRDWWELDVVVSGNTIQPSTFPAKRGRRFASFRPTKPVSPTPPPPVRGHLALGGSGVVFRNIRLKPINEKPIFDGKDLAGWKEIPGKKSKFSVTKEGWLNVKDGPGDLQTEGQWADFVLQLDCYSNGDHLNSGVFFRAIPGQFWSGYEAQIRNQWKDDDRSKAVDYGTGGIYNRQPARKVVSSDRAWFTMTIAANGKHMAVWVNGYQTADFTDNRPPSDNARKGCKVAKGPISIQGHDRTTDLSFRNLRITDLSTAPTPPAVKDSVPLPDKK
jgi:hypothetical protein